MSDKVEIPKEKFEFLRDDEIIFDEQLKTKSMGYFRDALSRFGKSKVNLIASTILLLVILAAIFIPMISSADVNRTDERLVRLNPKIPVIEKLGILDGISDRENTIGSGNYIIVESDGEELYFPKGFTYDYIKENSLKNVKTSCSGLGNDCIGGKVKYTIADDNNSFIAEYNPEFKIYSDTILKVDVDELGQNGNLKIYVVDNSDKTLMTTISSVGVTEVKLSDFVTLPLEKGINLQIEFSSNTKNDYVTLNSFEFYETEFNSTYETLYGGQLSKIKKIDGDYSVERLEAHTIIAYFEYDDYASAYGNYNKPALPKADYDKIIADNPDACALSPEPTLEYPNRLVPNDPDKCMITQVYGENSAFTDSDGNSYITYNVELNYLREKGLTNIPYYYFGTTELGRDLFVRVWLGARTSLFLGLIIATINIVIGVIYGSISGYYGGKTDLVMQRISEIVSRIPFLAVLAIFTAYLGNSPVAVIGTIVLTGWISIAYVTRTQFYRYKGREYVLASRTLGAKDRRLIFRHILPNGIGTLITASALTIPMVIFTESIIAYLGFGMGPNSTLNLGFYQLSGISIGALLADGQKYIAVSPYLVYAPSLIVSILMITFNMFGDALRDAFNPSLRGS